MWEEYERFRNNNEEGASSLDSERIRQVADILEDPVRHTVTKWTKLGENLFSYSLVGFRHGCQVLTFIMTDHF